MSPVFEHGALRLYLLKLLEEQPRHGYDLMQQLEERFEGLYTPSAGTIYPRLARLQGEGLVDPVPGEGGRKTYQLTDAGRAELAARRDELADLEAKVFGSARSLAREIRAEVRASVSDLRSEVRNAVRQVRWEERQGRAAGRTASPTPSAGMAEHELAAFSRTVLDRLGHLNESQVAALRGALAAAVEDVIRSVNG